MAEEFEVGDRVRIVKGEYYEVETGHIVGKRQVPEEGWKWEEQSQYPGRQERPVTG